MSFNYVDQARLDVFFFVVNVVICVNLSGMQSIVYQDGYYLVNLLKFPR